jgi:DNA polymerase III epsilon subunit-like protein
MHYIILDLEWNNTYARRTKGFLNEIIEIGAVMLDDNLNTIDNFSCLV